VTGSEKAAIGGRFASQTLFLVRLRSWRVRARPCTQVTGAQTLIVSADEVIV
jgi:hypothetical protein